MIITLINIYLNIGINLHCI